MYYHDFKLKFIFFVFQLTLFQIDFLPISCIYKIYFCEIQNYNVSSHRFPLSKYVYKRKYYVQTQYVKYIAQIYYTAWQTTDSLTTLISHLTTEKKKKTGF